MRGGPKTLTEIRSAACNSILVTVTLLAIPAAGASLLRSLEQGWKAVMGLHIAVVLTLIAVTLRRHHLSLTFRSITIIAIPFSIALGGLLTYGRGNGVSMFFISSCMLAGCFFNRRAALGFVALCVATLLAVYTAFRFGLIDLPVSPGSFDMTALSRFALSVSFLVAAVAPIIGLSALLQSLEAERQRADEAAQVRADFLAHMSHELRTPMAGLIGMAEALKGTRLDDQQTSFANNLLGAGQNLLSVLNDVLDFSKFETGHIQLDKQPFSISDMVRKACAAFEPAAVKKGVAFTVDVSRLTQNRAVGDSHRIAHVLANLVDNAVKFTARGEIAVRAEQTPRDGGDVMLVCSVVDTGIGLTAEQAEQIFEPFTQADASISRKYGGSGLGLAICRKLAEAMGGEIFVTSQLARGSTFTFRVPLAAERVETSPITATARVPSNVPVLLAQPKGDAPLRILVAEDNANMQMLIDIMLPRFGYVVTVVHDGAAAVTAAGRRTYDCIVMDMHMPIMNGPDAMRAIHNAEAAKGAARTPMIALTADLIAEHVREFHQAGADTVVGKPVDWSILDTKIRELTAERVPLTDA